MNRLRFFQILLGVGVAGMGVVIWLIVSDGSPHAWFLLVLAIINNLASIREINKEKRLMRNGQHSRT